MSDEVNNNPKLTDKQNAYINLLFNPECKGKPHLAAAKAGYAFGPPPLTQDMRDEIITRTDAIMAQAAPNAAGKLAGILDDSIDAQLSTPQHIKAATEILDRVGLSKVEKVAVQSNGSVIVILPPKEPIQD